MDHWDYAIESFMPVEQTAD